MVREGHEVASHGYGHINIYEQTPAEFREDIRRSKKMLEDLIGKEIVGYRAPCFSLGKAGDWPFEILVEEGFRYDSSIFPSPTYRNGRANWPAHPVRVNLPSGQTISEFPAATLKLFGRLLPVAGGGYFRLLPWTAIRWCVARSLPTNQIFTLYCHPYEFDADEFSHLPLTLSFKTRLHQGLGRKGFERKFRNLMDRFPTATMGEMMSRDWPDHQLPK
jgi:polysaccharide deacetylase family protein (PEP-CTERM system associated)